MTSSTSVRDSLAVQSLLTIHDPEADPEEIMDAVAWVNAFPENQAAFDRARAFWDQCDSVGFEAGASGTRAPSSRRRARAALAQKMLASVVAAAACLAIVVLANAPRFAGGGPRTAPLEEVHAYSTRDGEIRKLRLADGSEVTLGGASSISFQSTPARRLVVLSDGEAIFDVAKDATRPFTVMSGDGSTTALGTRFSVRKSPDGVRVVLARGSVRVAAGKEAASSAILTPGTQIAYSGAKLHDLTAIDAEAAMSWPEGRIFFLREPLNSVVYSLNRYCQKKIIVEGEIANTPVSGVADLSDILPWLKAVAEVVGAEVVESDDAFRIRGPSKAHVAMFVEPSQASASGPST